MGRTKNILVAWIGGLDVDKGLKAQSGPIRSALDEDDYSHAYLLYNYSPEEKDCGSYLKWLKGESSAEILAHYKALSSPQDLGQIYEAADELLASVTSEHPGAAISLQITPGTPAMQAVWMLLGKTKYSGVRFLQSSEQRGVEEATIPFDISAEYIPTAKKLTSEQLARLSETDVPANAAFGDIITRSDVMLNLIKKAQVLAEHEVPVLIEGDSGTGKELFARAIHNASPRKDKAFIAVNCGAFPAELIDSMLFGHKKGAFTGAVADKPGFFEQADGGTLFLDEFGELEPAVQVRLLRVLQDKSFVRIGDSKEQSSDFRLIAATNKNLVEEIAAGAFREDLFYRVAVGVLALPPLGQRPGDLMHLVDSLFEGMGQEFPLLKGKKISPSARNVIQKHPWPGNIRELKATLLRAALWSSADEISDSDMSQALFNQASSKADIMTRPLDESFDLEGVVGEVATHYIDKALQQTAGQKSMAAKLLGFKSHQTLANWQKKYGNS